MADCITDFDCPGNLVCFKDVSWSNAVDIGDLNGTSFCDCDGFYGWTLNEAGDDCSVVGPQTVFWLVANVPLALFNTFGLIKFGLVYLPVLCSEKFRRWTPLTQTFTFVSAFFFFRTIVCILFIANIYDRDGYGDPYKNDMFYAPAPMPGYGVGDKRGSLTTWVQGLLALSHVLNILASANIALVWCDVAFKAKNMLLQSSPKFMRFRVFIRVIQSVYLIIYFFNFLIADDPYVWVLLGLLRVVLGITFVLAYRWFAELKKGTNAGQEHLKTSQLATVFRRISKTILLIIVALAIVVISGFTLLGLAFEASSNDVPGREMIRPGKITAAPVLYAVLSYFYTMIALVIGWYLSTVLHSYYTASKSKSKDANANYTLQGSTFASPATSNRKVVTTDMSSGYSI